LKKALAIILLLISAAGLSAQTAADSIVVIADTNCIRFDEKDSAVYSVVAVQPQFPGGSDAFIRFMDTHVHVPSNTECCCGTFCFSFIVLRDGRIVNPMIIKGANNCAGLNDAVLDALCQMPRWQPGMQDGQPVLTNYTQRIILEFQK
jgi:hypothetical protein